jgi:Domain of unknown function (DUF4389)
MRSACRGTTLACVTGAGQGIRVHHSDDGARSRVTVFFRFILVIPHLIWLLIWGIGVVVVLPVHWVIAVVLGRSAGWAHAFYTAYVRYALHVYAYWYLAAERYPGFIGDPGYVVDAEIGAPERQRRWAIALRLILAIPAFVLSAVLGNGFGWGGGSTDSADSTTIATSFNLGLSFVIAFLAWFASLALARTPQGLRDAQVYCLGYATQVFGYFFLLTDRYPTSDPNAVALSPMPDHPVRLSDGGERSRNRLLVLFRLPLAVPHFVWLTLWSIVAFVVAVAGWVVALVIGRVPDRLHRFLGAFIRYSTHVVSFVYVLGGPYPGFLGRAGSYPVDLEIDPPRPQPRLKTLFRMFLALPALLAGGAFSTVMLVAGIGAWWAGLVVGRIPEGLKGLLAWAVRYEAQFYGYLLLVTARYPYTGPDGRGRPEATAPQVEPSAGAAQQAWQNAPEVP